MASTEAIEELTREDLGDLRECISEGLVFSDERPVRLSWHESLEWCEWYDLEILQAWAETHAGRA
jgi:hypothetical protein